jgi:hypothetical protein
MISLRMEFTAFSRRADAKIALLKEIIGRIQNGEEVDVEGLLGTGDAQREKEWEEGNSSLSVMKEQSLIMCTIVLQEIEQEDQAWEQSRKSKRMLLQRLPQVRREIHNQKRQNRRRNLLLGSIRTPAMHMQYVQHHDSMITYP